MFHASLLFFLSVHNDLCLHLVNVHAAHEVTVLLCLIDATCDSSLSLFYEPSHPSIIHLYCCAVTNVTLILTLSHILYSEQGVLLLVVQFLNLVSGAHVNSRMFWSKVLPDAMILRFGRVVLNAVPELPEGTAGTIQVNRGWCGAVEEQEGEKQGKGKNGEGGKGEGDKGNGEAGRGGNGRDQQMDMWQLCQLDRKLLSALLPQLCSVSGIRLSLECRRQLTDFQDQEGDMNQRDGTPWDVKGTVPTPITSQDRSDSCNVTNITDSHRFHTSSCRDFHALLPSRHTHARQRRPCYEFVMADILEIVPVSTAPASVRSTVISHYFACIVCWTKDHLL